MQTFVLGKGIRKSHPFPNLVDLITTPHYLKASFPTGLKLAPATLTGSNFPSAFYRSALNVQFLKTSTAIRDLSILQEQFQTLCRVQLSKVLLPFPLANWVLLKIFRQSAKIAKKNLIFEALNDI